jgi:hypothetical protein
MFIKELDSSFIDPFGDFFSHLVWAALFNHIQLCPAGFCLGARGSAHEKGVLELSLQVIFLDMVCEGSRNFSSDGCG